MRKREVYTGVMPPETSPENETSKLLTPPKRTSVGPVMAILIILALLISGALYFVVAHRNVVEEQNQIPYIPSGTTTIIIQE